jgi:hypothetical protein
MTHMMMGTPWQAPVRTPLVEGWWAGEAAKKRVGVAGREPTLLQRNAPKQGRSIRPFDL